MNICISASTQSLSTLTKNPLMSDNNIEIVTHSLPFLGERIQSFFEQGYGIDEGYPRTDGMLYVTRMTKKTLTKTVGRPKKTEE